MEIIHPLWPFSYHQASDTMKTEELSKQVRDKVEEKYKWGWVIKKDIQKVDNPVEDP